jgi:hypothetical protein
MVLQRTVGNRAVGRLLALRSLMRNSGATLPAGLGAGDHVWYWNGKVSTDTKIPQQAWFGTTGPNDYGGRGTEIYEFVIYEDHVKRGQPHMLHGKGSFAWLNNNPGNLTAGGTNVGEYPGKRNWHNFIIFPTPEAGLSAIPKFLKANGYGTLSLTAAFKRYAPKGDGTNDPMHYAQSVADATGVSVDTKISDLSDDQLTEVAKAIARMEGTVPGDGWPVGDGRIPAEVGAMLGGSSAPLPPAPSGSVITIPEVTIVGDPNASDPDPGPGNAITIPEVTIVGDPNAGDAEPDSGA